jgi:hypothetical protein
MALALENRSKIASGTRKPSETRTVRRKCVVGTQKCLRTCQRVYVVRKCVWRFGDGWYGFGVEIGGGYRDIRAEAFENSCGGLKTRENGRK